MESSRTALGSQKQDLIFGVLGLLLNFGAFLIFCNRAIPYWIKFNWWDQNAAKINGKIFLLWIVLFGFYITWGVFRFPAFTSALRNIFVHSLFFGIFVLVAWWTGWILLFFVT